MPSYAAIRLNRDTVISVLGNVEDTRERRERLIWAMFRYPYQHGVEYYFIGGNYLRLTQPDYFSQILSKTELDLLFTYEEKEKKQGRPDPKNCWFVVKLRDPNPDIIIDLCSTWY